LGSVRFAEIARNSGFSPQHHEGTMKIGFVLPLSTRRFRADYEGIMKIGFVLTLSTRRNLPEHA
jgi:hypothetical protein